MNLQQLEYITQVNRHRHFAKAADKSGVTQPTLSMMIQKLEEELGVTIFDRSTKPVIPTREGKEIILRAKEILTDVARIKEFAAELREEISGELHLGIIPTLAPYLLPLFLKSFTKKYPHLRIYIKEMITDEIILNLKSGVLDIGLLATPLNEPLLSEYPLFYEEFFAYASHAEKLPNKKYILPKDINLNHLWLLEEGHCLRNQVFNLCELMKQDPEAERLHYEAGSIETLINLVDSSEGITILPQLALLNLRPQQKKKVREFARPRPVREISIVTGINFPRHKLLKHLTSEILSFLPFEFTNKNKNVLKI